MTKLSVTCLKGRARAVQSIANYQEAKVLSEGDSIEMASSKFEWRERVLVAYPGVGSANTHEDHSSPDSVVRVGAIDGDLVLRIYNDQPSMYLMSEELWDSYVDTLTGEDTYEKFQDVELSKGDSMEIRLIEGNALTCQAMMPL